MVAIWKVKNGNRNTVFANEIQRKGRDAAIAFTPTAVHLNFEIFPIVEWLKDWIFFYWEGSTSLGIAYFALILFTYAFHIFANGLWGIFNYALILFAKLVYNANIESTWFIPVVNLNIWVVGCLYWAKVLVPNLTISLKETVSFLGSGSAHNGFNEAIKFIFEYAWFLVGI